MRPANDHFNAHSPRPVEAMETRMRNRAATLGKENGYSYAEGFEHIVVPG